MFTINFLNQFVLLYVLSIQMQFISLPLQIHYQLTKLRLQVQADLKICKML